MDQTSPPNIVDLTIVLPVLDEAVVLGRVLDDICAAFVDLSFEIIVVVDTRSVDGSAQLLEEYAETLLRGGVPPILRIISLSPPRCGTGTARMIGSRESRGALIGWMDADGTHSPSDLRRLVDTIGSADQVVGTRARDFGHASRLRFLVKLLVTKLAALLWCQPDLADLNSGMRIFRRDRLFQWLNELPEGFSCATTATLAALNHGQSIRFSQISYFARSPGTKSKFHPLFDTARLLRVVWRQWRRKPKPSHVAGKLVS